ncbi:MAG: nuclear transport factor 2 family protein [Legionella sp.]|nr:nuclear transport factor 2 family protein [Legionella sp.]
MSKNTNQQTDEQIVKSAQQTIKAFLEASMKPDPEKAFEYMAEGVDITFTGGIKFSHPREASAFNAKRYNWVKKKLGSFDVSIEDAIVTVYSFGSLYGEWPDGTEFENNRYIDRFIIEDGKIVKMDVINDSAERILKMKGIDA